MPDSVLEGRGAQVTPVPGAPLYTNRFFSGLWTQSSPLRDAATPFLYEMFYSASRFERLIGGGNIEISPKLTVVRRPGTTVYNSALIPPVNRFFEFRAFSAGSEDIKMLASVDPESPATVRTVRDVTGPNTNATLFTKQAGAGKTFFLGVGNVCFFGDGLDEKKYLQSGKQWTANTVYNVGDYIIDSNGNIQSFQSQATHLTITDLEAVQVTLGAGVVQNFVIVTLGTSPIIPPLQNMSFSGITAAAFLSLNGTVVPYQNIASGWNLNLSANQIAFDTALPPTASTASAGTIATFEQQDSGGNPLTGTSGATQPVWSTGQQGITQDGPVNTGITWSCYTSPVQDWSVKAPLIAPVATPGLSIGYWAAKLDLVALGYPASGAAIIDSNAQYQVAQAPGVTGSNQPMWNKTLGGLTTDGTVAWLNAGTVSSWIATFQYTTSVTCLIDTNNNLQVTTDYFQTQTIWTAGIANTNGATNITGATQPTWNTARGGVTADGAYSWINAGPAAQLTAGTLQYASSYHSIDGSVTTASAVSYVLNPLIGFPGLFEVVVVVAYTNNPQVDQIYLWRTAGGQAALVFLDKIPNLTTIGSVGYHDVLPDTTTSGQQALNPFISAPIADSNDPPPKGFLPMAYHLTRVCGAVGNILYLSTGPDVVTGNGNTAFDPVDQFTLPSLITGMWSTTTGLIIFRIDGVTVMIGNGIGPGSLYCVDIFDNVGLPSQDAYDVRGNVIYMMTTTGKVLRLTLSQFMAAVQSELSEGLEDFEIGFPIGDTLSSTYTPSKAFIVWHEGPSEDSGLFVADGQEGWFNLKQLTQPEVCNPWSPKATFTDGVNAMASLETSPGIRTLVFSNAPGSSPAPLLQRDLTTHQDDGVPYSAFGTFGSIVMAQPGTQATVQFVVLETTAPGTRPSVGLLIDEISGPFRVLTKVRKMDPPNLPPSQTVPASRFWAMEGQKPVGCRHLQMQITWAEENAANELLTTAIYGRLPEKARR